uniref:lysine-specific demethylase JMJ25 n=1 Tax=Erigeron canadensis TaxID=72917 RepID=UPI001CB9C131|nr:lysine-specific demethylase JMJ25 [Erigeron canadensis]XP_043620661.1 lysine-specific demethylase JMJ25 [Erigeron canadensis]
MDPTRSNSATVEDNTGIPDDLRCKRSDGKQWRCHAMSMPDKTVCEKHYIQAKKRAANSAMRASLKKKRRPAGESDSYLESKSDDMDSPLADYRGSASLDKHMEMLSKKQISYSPETPSFKNSSVQISSKSNDDIQRDTAESGETPKAYRTPSSVADSSRSEKMHGAGSMMDTSDGGSESSEDTGVQICHQCRRDDKQNVLRCLRCDKRGYCDECISTWYPDIPAEEVHRKCPACRGCCSCKMCLRGDNMIKGKIQEIPAQEKLEHLFCLLYSVLPVVKQIHLEQCSELELERKLRGNRIDLPRTKLNADEQMCCDFCRIPIIDYHRHCEQCSYDICLRCCQDARKTSKDGGEAEVSSMQTDVCNEDTITLEKQDKPLKQRMRLSDKLCDWKANNDGSVPCPPKKHGGCGTSPLVLKRIFKMNWVAKLVKNVDEMVSGCKLFDINPPKIDGLSRRFCQFAERENSDDNFLYTLSCEDIKSEGIDEFRKQWTKGQPVIVRGVCDESSMLGWDPMVMWKGIQETTDERKKGDIRVVKAIDCFDRSEMDIELGQFIRGYSEGRMRKDDRLEMLVLKNWPSPSASEEFLLYQRPEFISKLPLLEYIHSKWGLLNLPAKLPHYSLQSDVGPKILISYGVYDELGQGDSVNNLHLNMRDAVYLLVHTCEVKPTSQTSAPKISDEPETTSETIAPKSSDEPMLSKSPITEHKTENDMEVDIDTVEDDITEGPVISTINNEKALKCEDLNGVCEETFTKSNPGAIWDIFRREDVPKLNEYMRLHCNEFGVPDDILNDCVPQPLHEGLVYLDSHHKRKLKEEFGIEPWSIEQHLGVAVFIPTGCPFQVRNLQSSVQLGLDFLFPESLSEAIRLAGEIRELPNDHDSKLQMLEVGKISLYAASSSIKEVQKLVLDPKLGAEFAFEDPNLTKLVSMNLEKMTKKQQVVCT